jgi:organic radical activating enzyme
MKVAEVYRSIQGEGPSAGRPATFVRLQGCSVGCHFCDTKFTWRPGGGFESTPQEVIDSVLRFNPVRLIVLTGGEPAEQPEETERFTKLLRDSDAFNDIRIEVETALPAALTVHPDVYLNVSPKRHLWQRDDDVDVGLDVTYFARIRELHRRDRTVLKFPVGAIGEDGLRSPRDWSALEAVSFARGVGFDPERVWLMPMGTSVDEMMKLGPDLAEFCANEGVNFAWRIHIALWGDARRR